MKYLKISNRGSTDRRFLEVFGLTTKRDSLNDRSVIGERGSGTKFAALAAFRLNLGLAIASSDRLGPYLLTFTACRDDDPVGDTAGRLVFNYASLDDAGISAIQSFPSHTVIEAFRDWDKPIGKDDKRSFKILRELICNARDADKEFRAELVDEIAPARPGETSIFLRYTPEIEAIFHDPLRYFKFPLGRREPMEKPLFSDGVNGEIWEKSDLEKTRLFVLGVLIECETHFYRRALFDYSMYRRSLVSEERIITSVSEFLAEVGKLFSGLTDVEIAEKILAGVDARTAEFELDALGYIKNVSPAALETWRTAVKRLFGDNVAITSEDRIVDDDCRQIFGYKVLGAHRSAWRRFLKLLGYPDASDIACIKPEDFEIISFAALDDDSRARFLKAFNRFAKYAPRRSRLPIVIYFPPDGRPGPWAGFAGFGDGLDKEIWLAAATRTSLGAVEEIFTTLMHEGRHCETLADDYDRRFTSCVERELTAAIWMCEGEIALSDGTPLLPLDESGAVAPNLVEPGDRKK